MKRYIVRRLLWGILVIWLVSVVIFCATRIGPDPVLMMAEPGADEAYLDSLRKRFALDKPLPVQYLVFVTRALQGDFGVSLYFTVPASDLIFDRLPASLELVAATQIISLLIGLLAGILGATSRSKWIGNLIRRFSFLGLSMPNFVIGLIALLLFSVYWDILPTSGRGGIKHLLMPAFSLGWYFSAGNTRIIQSSLLEVLNQEYIKLARIQGLPDWFIVFKHALRNALIPLVTLAGIHIVTMISAAVAIETVFVWPGLGFLLYEAATNRDFNTVQGVIIVFSAMTVIVNLMIDILYAYIDPRIRYT